MKKYYIVLTTLLFSWSCMSDEEFLTREPTNILLTEDIFKDERLVLSVMADFYNRIPELQHNQAWWEFTNFDEAFASAFSDYWRHQQQDYPYNWWSMWDYGHIRDLNIFLQMLEEKSALDPEVEERFMAEARFLRANVYFEMVKRMGGVPLILEPMTYDFSGDPTYLQHPRAQEHEIYDFIISEMEAIKSMLPNDPSIKSRATTGLALAMECRAALYAGSIARYGSTTPSVSLPGGEVGIPAEMAEDYYTIALRAAKEITGYSLYQKEENLQVNFANLFLDKSNPEVIFVRDYQLQSGKVNSWTLDHQPMSLSDESATGGRINPSLNLVQSFELLDNTFAPLQTKDVDGNYIYYDNPEDIFAGRDARLWGTVMYPGTMFKGQEVDIWAGLILADGSKISADKPGDTKEIDGEEVQVVGADGPIDGYEFTAQTGFYVRKYQDPTVGSGRIGTRSDVWWIRYRYAEVLLNAAEAAFELDQKDVAASYMNQVRARAGFTKALTAADITFDRIVHERRVELAFEGHQLWDMKRWRLAHVVWNGEATDLTNTPGKADEPSTRVFGLWPYKIHDPGNPNHGKWVYEKILPSRVTNAHRFRLGNYYSFINNDILNNNPKIVKNPNH